MAKLKLTKGELKRQRDALRQYERYLPTLQLKKQQLQIELLEQHAILSEKKQHLEKKKEQAFCWAGLLAEPQVDIKKLLSVIKINTQKINIAGVDIQVFKDVEFSKMEYDLYAMPLWVDTALDGFKEIVSLQEEISVIEEGIAILKAELRLAAQRVNLFEKVKIPQATEAIRVIKIYIGDQMTNAIGRSKIAKRKIERVLAKAPA